MKGSLLVLISLLAGCTLGARAKLPSLDELRVDSSSLKELAAGASLTVITFFSSHCPCQRAHDERLRALADTYGPRGVRFVAIDAEREASKESDETERRMPALSLPDPHGCEGHFCRLARRRVRDVLGGARSRSSGPLRRRNRLRPHAPNRRRRALPERGSGGLARGKAGPPSARKGARMRTPAVMLAILFAGACSAPARDDSSGKGAEDASVDGGGACPSDLPPACPSPPPSYATAISTILRTRCVGWPCGRRRWSSLGRLLDLRGLCPSPQLGARPSLCLPNATHQRGAAFRRGALAAFGVARLQGAERLAAHLSPRAARDRLTIAAPIVSSHD